MGLVGALGITRRPSTVRGPQATKLTVYGGTMSALPAGLVIGTRFEATD
jgi:hypothetical protein